MKHIIASGFFDILSYNLLTYYLILLKYLLFFNLLIITARVYSAGWPKLTFFLVLALSLFFYPLIVE